ncbi:sensor histidine kinase [Neptunitalea lumnitzerae]|uniref:histidine kinase n=1 Tax=Neptunitalea lumnitzerae TaxID=2965509 RepID=A0ABQ5MJT2_9FLAO|nr:sensor histidine kinase [Neptunitalea sp. Y10]GLB49597.1 two-component sensor histidine kinase [Neptunitalea sp. Y10]
MLAYCFKRRLLLLFCFCFILQSNKAQDSINANKLKNTYQEELTSKSYNKALKALNTLGDYLIYKEINHKESYLLFHDFKPFLQKCTNNKEIAKFYINYAEGATYAQDYEGSLEILKEGSQFLEKIKDSNLYEYGYVYLKAAENTTKLNMFSESSIYFQKAEAIFNHQQDTLMWLWTKNGLSTLFSNYAIYDKAAEERAFIFEVTEKNKYGQVLAIAHIGAASDAFFLDKPKDELYHIQEALKANNKETDISEIVNILTLAFATTTYARQEQKENSNYYFKLLNDKLKAKNGQIPFIDSYYKQAQSLHALVNSNYKQAEEYAQELLNNVNKANDWQAVARTYLLMASIYEKQKNEKDALRFFKKYVTLKDSVNEAASRKKFAYVQTQFETEKKDLEIIRNNQNIKLLQARNRIINQRYIFGGIIILSIFIVIYIWRLRIYAIRKARLQKQFAQHLIQHLEQERKRIAGELHDSIGQNLLLIKNKQLLNKEEDTVLIEQTIDEVRNMSQSLHPFQFEKLGLLTSIKHTIQNFQRNSMIFYSGDIQVNELKIDKEKEIFIYRMIQECLANVEKHSKAKACRVLITENDSYFKFEIKDNGVGFNLNEKKEILNSLGLKNLKERAQIIGAILDIHSIKGKGTTTLIKILKD